MGAFLIAIALAGGLWIGIQQIPWLGPTLADGARSLLGPGAVAWAEDVFYGAADKINVWLRSDEAPATLWDAPQVAPPAPPPEPARAEGAATPQPSAEPPRFPPPPFQVPFEKVAAAGDGAWIAMADPDGQPGAPIFYKAALHPDPKRPFAVIAVVAIDLDRADLHLVAGTTEPESNKVAKNRRPGLVPQAELAGLLAAFNGGFKAVHGHYGMMLDGETYVVPRDVACTIGFLKAGGLRLGTWSQLKSIEGDLAAYRQTPPCLVEGGEAHVGLSQEYNRNWGAAVDGETIIRRSAIGIDVTGRTLFYGLGEAVTAQSLGRGMSAVGAKTVDEIDINYTYPRFFLFSHTSEPPRLSVGLIRDLKFRPDEYVVEPATRDFFYVTRKRPTS